MSIYIPVGRRIRETREAKGWTQTRLGDEMLPPRSHSAVSDIERGKTKLNLDELALLAGVLDTSILRLVAGGDRTNYEHGIKVGRAKAFHEIADYCTRCAVEREGQNQWTT